MHCHRNSALTQTASYNNLNQLTNLSGQTSTFDANGNLLSDGLRTYSWDAENRLVAITYPGQPGKATAFTYDGLGRRIAIAATPAGGGSAIATSYIWCGLRPCLARNTANATTREYYGEGEFVPGSPMQAYYYGPDRIGSVRRVFASASSAPAYSYDPYGNPLQVTAQLTDLGYAGMFTNSDSGLNLTAYRAYNPIAGRWLSRDPMGEIGGGAGNLYPYVDNDPLNGVDLAGLCTLQIGFAGSGSFLSFFNSLGGIGIAIDSQGNSGVYVYAGVGKTVGISADGGLSVQYSNAETIGDLSGIFTNYSLHGGTGVGGSVDYFNGESGHGPVMGGGASIGAAAGASATAGKTWTAIISPSGVYY